MKKLKTLFLFTLIISSMSVIEVNSQNIEENTPIELNGLKISYRILNHTVKKIKNTEYERYEIKFEVKNISGTEIINLEGDKDETTIDFSTKETNNNLVTFNCLNANGKRLTSKEKRLAIKPHIIEYKFNSYNKKGEKTTITKYITTAHVFSKGETISSTAIFLVPKGEKPKLTYSE